ncbi:non-ribosomal peptide synthetase, partial [Oceaniglobus roseus]|uniref:non-ribosomal peptide synthetase n=1 Tax=Oceaniglobus roseus TaxID=1737570 RepID=UPI0012FFE897
AYLPLDPDHPDERLAFMLADAAPALVVAEADRHARLSRLTDAPLLTPDPDPTLPATPPAPTATPDTLAYVIYTSGSTGRPKGVMVGHGNVVRLFTASEAAFGFGPEDVWTLFHSHAFDFSVWEIFGALLHGGTLVIVPWLTSRDPRSFHRLLVEERVTILNQTPSAFRQLADARLSQPDPAPLALRRIVFGGEALNIATLAPWFAAHGTARPTLVNMYGITETTVHVPHLALDEGTGPGAIGDPLADLAVRVLDAGMNPVPPGITGEMFVAGAGLARGYLNRPDLTAERFVPDPYGPPGSRLYRTGDLAQVTADGGLRYVGRSDAQVKVRGFRIETGEVEAAILAVEGVAEAVVDLRDGRLVAWHRSSRSDTDLREALAARLPGYMVPAAFVAVGTIPLTPNGKADRAALPDPAPETDRPYTAPRTARETTLAAIWQEVLGLPRVGIDDNFFAIGGDSMRAVTVAARARDEGIPLGLDDLFRHQTIARLPSPGAEAPQRDTDLPPLPPLPPSDVALLPPGIEAAWPMTRLQLGMIFHAEADPDAALYHDVFSFRLAMAWDEPSFRQALAVIAGRHPMLRAEFDLARFSRPLQLIHARLDLPLTVTDISALPPEAQSSAIAEAIAAEKATPFEMRRPPYLRLMVHLRGPGDVQITLGFHHAILDGWSVASLQVELLDTWARLRAGEDAGAAPLRSDVSASIAAEHHALLDPAQSAWWQAALRDQTPLQLPKPLDGPAPAGPVRIALDPDAARRLRDLAAGMGVPLRSVLLAAHVRVMAVWGGTADVTTGLVTHTRTEMPDAEKVLGLFLNTLPLRIGLRAEGWRDLVLRTFEAERQLTAHRFYPLAQIVEDLGHEAPFDVVFNHIDFHVHEMVQDRATRVLEVEAFEATNFAFGVTAVTAGGGLVLTFAHDPARVDGGVVRRIAADYARALERIAEDPQAPARLPLDPGELAEQAGWNATGRAFAEAGQTLHGLVEAMAARHPGRVALRFEGRSLRYAALEAEANRLAHGLIAQGAGPERAVGICTARGPGMIVAILAVLKAGAAYLPLDPDHPDERLAFMLADAAPALVVAEADRHARLSRLTDAPLLTPEPDPALPATPPPPTATPGSLAYVIYTSGSTGKPKGVMVGHRAIVNRMLWQREALAIAPADRIVQKTPCGFDVSVSEIFLPLIAGAALVIARPGGHLDVGYLSGLVRAEGVTVAHFVPPMLDTALALADPADLAGLRVVMCSGQALARSTQDRLERILPGIALHNLYGPTEAAVDVTHWPCHADDPRTGPGVPIGRPIDNVAIYILDDALNPVPLGVAGHLYIGGVALARGYLNRPDLTAEAFVPDPFGPPGARMYRSGDRARYLPNGAIDYLGRSDDQIKVRGVRIEPGEIEAAIRACGIAETVVMAPPDANGEPALTAWLVGWNGDAAGLRAALARRLPAQLVPQHLVTLPALPLTPNGKVDRRALPSPDRRPSAAQPPRTATEVALARLWAELLGVEQVGRDDNFFRLGGHSLSLLRMLARVQRDLGVTVSLRTFMAVPDLAGLAMAIDGIREMIEAPPEGASPDNDTDSETETILL